MPEFLANFAKLLRTPFLQNTSGGCFWIVLSFQRLYKSDFSMHKSKSLRNILKRIGRNIEPYGTPDKIF